MNPTRTTASIPDALLERIVGGTVVRFWKQRGGDLEEYLSIAFFQAARALNNFDGRGTLEGYISHSIRLELLEVYRRQCVRRKREEHMPPQPQVREGWDAWCRRLAMDLGDDARAVILAALEAPGEVAEYLIGEGWSGPRVVQAMSQVKEAVR